MLKINIDAHWPLVQKRQTEVLAAYEQIAKKHSKVLRIDRATLLRDYNPGRDFNDLARDFSVSPSAVNNALSALVRIARGLEHTATLGLRSNGKRRVVIVPVTDDAQAQSVINLLAQHKLTAVVEDLDCGDELDAPRWHT